MFTVDKTAMPRYWSAYSGHAKERIGESCGNEGEFATEAEAVSYAKRLLLARLTDDYKWANKYSRLVLAVYAIRATWNSKLREALASYYKKRAEAHKAMLNPPAVKISYVPEQIAIEGDRLAIGTKVYVIDTWGMTLKEKLITHESFSYYDFNDVGKAIYQLDNTSSYIYSTLTSSYSNVEIYLDKYTAATRIRGLWQDKIASLQNQINSL